MCKVKYNGWSNYETWLASFALDDLDLMNYAADFTEEDLSHDNFKETVKAVSDEIQHVFISAFEANLNDPLTFNGTIFSTIMNNFIEEVNWLELAETWCVDNLNRS